MRMHRSVSLMGLLLALDLAGCGRALNREQLAKEVVQRDPEFSWVLDKHRALANRIETYQRELALKRTTVDQSIAQLRKDLATATVNVKTKIEDVKKQIEPDAQRLNLALASAAEELRTKQFQRSSLGRSIARLRKAMKAAQGVLTNEERVRQETQVEEMLHDAARLDHEIKGLKEHMRLLKMKLILIKL